MKPPPFEYLAPHSLEEALALFGEHGMNAKALAGGQSLIPAMNFRLAGPQILVDLNRIPKLSYIRENGSTVSIGAMTRQRTLERDDVIKEKIPLLFETIPYIAHPQIRNRGTLGGSIVHADPAAELPVIACTLEAEIVLRNTDGERRVKASEFFFGMFMVNLMPGEMLTEIIFPARKARTGYAFSELARRHGDYAMMGVAAVLELDENGNCVALDLVYLNAGDKPTPAPLAASILTGRIPGEDLFAEVAASASTGEITPFGNMHASEQYQRHLARILTERTLLTAYHRALTAANSVRS